MKNDIFSINLKDIYRGLITSVIAGILTALYGIVIQSGFDLFTADWIAIGKLVLNSAVGAFIGYLGKNFLSDKDGKLLGRIG